MPRATITQDSCFTIYPTNPYETIGTAANVMTIGIATTSSGFYTPAISGTFWGIASTVSNAGAVYPNPHQIEAVRKDYMDVQRDPARKRAEEKARLLFIQVAGEIAFEKFKTHRYHEIRGASGTVYRLQPGRRVLVLNDAGQVDHELCGHLPFGIPWWDTMVVQHLMLTGSLETEERFKKIANRTRPGAPYVIPELGEAA